MKRLLILTLMQLFCLSAFAKVTAVKVVCPAATDCSQLQSRATNLLEGKNSRADIEKAIEFMLLDQSIDRLAYEIHDNSVNDWQIILEIVPKVKIIDVDFKIEGTQLDLTSALAVIPLKESGYYDPDLIPETKRIVSDYLYERGFQKAQINFTTKQQEDGIQLIFNIKTGIGIKVDKILIHVDIASMQDDITHAFAPLRGQNWNSGEARRISELYEQSLFARGFWNADVAAKLNQTDSKNVLNVEVKSGGQFLFTFKGNNAFSRSEIMSHIRDSAKSSNLNDVQGMVRESIEKLYDTVGLYHVEIDQRQVNSVDKFGVPRIEIHIVLKEHLKTKLGKIVLDGNQFIDDEKFEEILDNDCSVLVCRGYYDRKFFVDFSDKLRKNYLQSGFVMANVTSPEVREAKENKLDVRYVAIENQRVELTHIDLPGVPGELIPKILEKFNNKQGQPLDVTEIENDMNSALDVLREEGYFFARLAQLRDAKVVRYGRSFQTATIVIPFDTGKKTYFDGVLVTGNKKTQSIVIEREIELKKGDLVTSHEVNKLRDRLVGLGLFATVTITPFLTQSSLEDKYWLSFLVEVKERDFGLGELAPGYRTDLGPKASLQFSYNNLQGKNRTVTFRTQANLRLNSDEFDARRSTEDHRLPEFSLEASYREPWLFYGLLGSKWEFEFSSSFKRQRFFGFDADIFRVGPRLTKQFGDHFTASVRYQFEDIRQFDATEIKDGDRFQIGGITPSISIDYRDNPIIPTKGAFFGLAWEFANPYFLSQSRDNLEINFNKLTSRNRFYYPVGNLVFALSVSAGYQRNFADELQHNKNGDLVYGADGKPLTVGYIPSIKVFRLDGVDNVRGFGDDEINRLADGMDIGELRIQDTVTYVNYKLEPRYYFSDLVALGVFFDAGGIYVNQFVPLKVRTAVGISAKLVTPVGSLDFDYGIKLHRRSYASGQRESFGRFHLSIGSF